MGWRGKGESPLLFGTVMPAREPRTAVSAAAAITDVLPKYRRRRAFPLLPAFQSPACLPLAESSPCSSGSSNYFILNALYSSSFVWKSWGGFHFPAQILTYIPPSSSYSVISRVALVFTGLNCSLNDLVFFLSLVCFSFPAGRQGLREQEFPTALFTFVSPGPIIKPLHSRCLIIFVERMNTYENNTYILFLVSIKIIISRVPLHLTDLLIVWETWRKFTSQNQCLL